MSGEWGHWIEHDGKGCPVAVGTVVEATFENLAGEVGDEVVTVGAKGGFSWDWSYFGKPPYPGAKYAERIIRYRLRKPRGLTVLEGLLENLPEKVDA